MNERERGGGETERNCIVMDGYMLMNKKRKEKKRKKRRRKGLRVLNLALLLVLVK